MRAKGGYRINYVLGWRCGTQNLPLIHGVDKWGGLTRQNLPLWLKKKKMKKGTLPQSMTRIKKGEVWDWED